jgi:hypothetical protein
MQMRKHGLTTLIMTVFVVTLALMASSCNLLREADYLASRTAAASPTPNGTANASVPTVSIISPVNNAEVVVNQPVLITVIATDAVGVTRMTLLVNNVIAKTVNSEDPAGDPTFSAVFEYTPTVIGTLPLTVLGYRNNVVSQPAALTLNVRANQNQVTATPIVPLPPVPPVDDPTCRALINVGLNVRTGPNTAFPVLTVLAAGSIVPVTGRTGLNDWLQILVNTSQGWVNASFVTTYGRLCASVPIVASPPLPATPIPTQTPVIITPPIAILTPTFTPVPLPADLVITNITGPAMLSLGGGASVTSNFSVTITNIGGTATGQFNNVIQVTPGGSETALGVVSNLFPGESIVLNVNLTFTAPGLYTITARADSSNQVPEISEVNNTGTMSVTVTA